MPFWSRGPGPIPGELSLVVGLGNPGAQYERTRHNVGFMVTNELAARVGVMFRSSKHMADTARADIGGLPILLAQPQTFMNDSGRAVQRLVQYYHVPLDRLIVIADDLDLPFGTIRIRPSGSSGGQKGIQSTIAALGTDQFPRLRIGIGRPPGQGVNYVLGNFPPDEVSRLPELLKIAGDAVLDALTEGVQHAMNTYNRSWL